MEILDSSVVQYLYFLIAVVVVVTFQGWTQAHVAYNLGDPTPRFEGRMKMNPLKHMSLLGFLVFLFSKGVFGSVTFGWGKNPAATPYNFKNPVRDSLLTVIVGPIASLFLAFFIALFVTYVGSYTPRVLLDLLVSIFHVSIFLGVFSFMPLPPLAGCQVLRILFSAISGKSELKLDGKGVQYTVAILLVDVLVLRKVFGISVFGELIGFLHEGIGLAMFLST